jgi:hypothetical protein
MGCYPDDQTVCIGPTSVLDRFVEKWELEHGTSLTTDVSAAHNSFSEGNNHVFENPYT